MLHVERHKSGTKSAQGTLENGRREGTCSFWNDHGKKRAELEYLHGARHGWATRWHTRTNEKRAEGAYVDDAASGAWTFFHERGGIRASGTYVQGLATGAWSFFHPSGAPSAAGAYAHGLKV